MINLVSFPALGLEFSLNRVVIEIFGRPIYWYGLIIAVGFMLGTMLSARLLEKSGYSEDLIYDFLLYGVPASLVGLRTYFVVFYLDLFKNPDGSLNWAAIFRVSDGGMAIYGGILAGLLALYFFAKKREINYFAISDTIAVGLILGQGIGRWGNFMNVEAYGGLTNVPWRMCSSSIAEELLSKGYATPEQYAAILEGTLGVHPTFFYESVWNFLGLFYLLHVFHKKRQFLGQITCCYFMWYGFGRFIIEGMRTDSLYFFGLEFMGYPLRTSQMLSFCLYLGAFMLLQLGKKGKVPVFHGIIEKKEKSTNRFFKGEKKTMPREEEEELRRDTFQEMVRELREDEAYQEEKRIKAKEYERMDEESKKKKSKKSNV